MIELAKTSFSLNDKEFSLITKGIKNSTILINGGYTNLDDFLDVYNDNDEYFNYLELTFEYNHVEFYIDAEILWVNKSLEVSIKDICANIYDQSLVYDINAEDFEFSESEIIILNNLINDKLKKQQI